MEEDCFLGKGAAVPERTKGKQGGGKAMTMGKLDWWRERRRVCVLLLC